jgi:hypothetical protein
MKKFILAIGTLALTALAASNVFHITLNDPDWIGTNMLKPGDYKIEIAGDKATFKTGKTVVETAAKLENADHKFSTTSVVIETVQGKNQIKAIELGGTSQRLVIVNGAIPTDN